MRNLLSKYKSRKYLQRIVISTTVLIVSVLVLSSLSLYLFAERIVLEMQRDSNEKVLSQMNFNISYMNQIVENYAFGIFFDFDFQPLMESKDTDMFEYLRRVNKLKRMIAPNTFIHSLVFYNHYMDTLYTISNDNAKALDHTVLKPFLAGETDLRKLQFVPFKPDFGKTVTGWNSEVFSMFMYNGAEKYDPSESFLMVNVDQEWLFQNIALVNGMAANKNGHIYLLDQNKRILSGTSQPPASGDELKEAVYRHLEESGSREAQFTFRDGKAKQIVNYMANADNNWTIVSVQPYEIVLGPLEKLKTACAVIIAACLLIGIAVALVISQRLYNPIERLLGQLRRLTGAEAEEVKIRDEMLFMSQIYSQTVEKMKAAETNLDRSQMMVKAYYLRKLITDSAAFSAQELKECAERHYFHISPNGGLMLIVLLIDQVRKQHKRMSARERSLTQFAVANIAEEIVSAERPCDVVSIRGEHFVIIVNAEPDEPDIGERLAALTRSIQDTVYNYYHVTLTAVLSDSARDYRMLTRTYGTALEYASYRLLFGAGSIITPERVARSRGNPLTHLPEEAEKKLMEAIRLGHGETAAALLEEMKEQVVAMSYESALQSIVRLGTVIHHAIRTLNRNKLAPVAVQVNHAMFEKETADEAFAEFAALLSRVAAEQKQSDNQKNEVLVETVKDFIHGNYADPGLSLQGIAAMLKISSAHTGRMFKKQCGLSVAEYMNEVRMSEAVRLLEDKETPIYEIVQDVGFANQNYFFKLFKQRFGSTPREYRMRRTIE